LRPYNDADEIQEGAEGRNQEKVETSIIQSLYNSITDSFVKPPIDKEAQGSHSDSNISTTIPKSQDTDQTSNSAWYSELLGVLESLGATLEHSDTNESKSDSRVSLEELAANESDYMSWLTGAKSKLDEVALQVQNQDWSAFTSFTAEEPENVSLDNLKQNTESTEEIARARTVKGRILEQISAVQAQLNRQVDEATAALGSAVQNMLPPQLQRPWIAECAQSCIDQEIHPDLLESTSVRVSSDICGQEADFQAKRAEKIRHDFAKFIGVSASSVDIRDIPVIGIAGSGGGFRAMISTLGSYRAMYEAGLAQCVTYDAAVSGSSWAIAALHTYANSNPYLALDSVREAMKTSMFSTSSLSEFVNENEGIAKRVFADIAARYLLSAAKSEDSHSDAQSKDGEAGARELQTGGIQKTATLLDRILGEAARRGHQAVDVLFPEKYQTWVNKSQSALVPLTMDELLEAAKSTLRTMSVPPLSVVDLYGALLFRKLIVQHVKAGDNQKPDLVLDPKWVKLSAQRPAVDEASQPMPIYTAVRHFIGTDDNDPNKAQSHQYQWFEFNPYEVGSIDHGAWIPSWAFGRPMVNGREQLKIGEAHFGGIIGAVSSAFCASFDAMIMELYTAVPSAVRSAMDPLLDWIEHGTEVSHPIPPYTLHNPFYIGEQPSASQSGKLAELESKPLLSLMDAGMENNLPFAPLLRPERNVDVIVCLDSSANIDIMPWFARAEAWAGDHGVERWPWGARPWSADPLRPSKAEVKLDQSTLSGTRSVRESVNKRIRDDNIRCVVFDQPVASSPLPKKNGSLPRPITILYIPLLPNAKFRDPDFDPETADFCGTFNDQWTTEQINLLADLASFNLTQEVSRIRDALKVAYKRKRAHRLYEEGLGA
ncbi:hypothetical protein IW139_001987, partial [Coemansia sp. RSA 353]